MNIIDMVARRLVAGALGVRSTRKTQAEAALDKQKLQYAKGETVRILVACCIYSHARLQIREQKRNERRKPEKRNSQRLGKDELCHLSIFTVPTLNWCLLVSRSEFPTDMDFESIARV